MTSNGFRNNFNDELHVVHFRTTPPTAKETAQGRPLKVPTPEEALDPYVLPDVAKERGLPDGRGLGKMPCRVQNCAGFD